MFPRSGGCRFEKLPNRYAADYILFKLGDEDIPVGIAEVKKRFKATIKTYPTGLYMPLSKYLYGKLLAEEIGVPFLFINELDDGIFYTKIGGNYGMQWGGPKVARDPEDREPEMLIGNFTKINVEEGVAIL